MKKTTQPDQSADKDLSPHSHSLLEAFFIHSLEEMYYAENAVAIEFLCIQEKIVSPTLREILKTHYNIHLKHKERIQKIFNLRNEAIEVKKCGTFNALLAEGIEHLSFFKDDIVNWEIGLILLSQKLTYYKIASYGGLAHLAINLKYYRAATLLAFSVQEEEEYISNNLNRIIDAFLSSHVAGYKS
ncbi:DUF892 family protein [Kaistella palustris]|uniref:DUF892 family protein n=1 Tax=Kaistella palustris TaxID=493376 RepID=UPI0003FDC629|nr:DUF892 family protein [Kaistella palustris]